MKLLLDTHVLLWAAASSPRLSTAARELIGDNQNSLTFSVASIWEVVIKHALGRGDFRADPAGLRRWLVSSGYTEWSVTSPHALAVGRLPNHHGDPFDRLLVAQAIVEGATLVTADRTVARYPVTTRLV